MKRSFNWVQHCNWMVKQNATYLSNPGFLSWRCISFCWRAPNLMNHHEKWEEVKGSRPALDMVKIIRVQQTCLWCQHLDSLLNLISGPVMKIQDPEIFWASGPGSDLSYWSPCRPQRSSHWRALRLPEGRKVMRGKSETQTRLGEKSPPDHWAWTREKLEQSPLGLKLSAEECRKPFPAPHQLQSDP